MDEITESSPTVKASYANYLNPPTYELYDLRKDPEEFINLSKDQRYKDVLEDLKSRMKRRQVEVGDPFHDAKIVKLWLLQEEEGRTSNYKAKKQWRWKYLDHFPSE